MSYNSKYKGAEVEAKLDKIDQLNAGMEDTDETVEDVVSLPFVSYEAQELTEEQKAQARENIGVDGASGVKVIDHGTTDTTFTLTPNVFHVWGEVDSLTISFGEAQSGVMNEYLFQFSSGANATALSLPEGVEWENGAYPEILANATHQVSIVNGLASIAHYYTRKYLTIEAIDAITVAFPAAVEYRVDGGKWTEAAASESVTASAGSRIQYRANLTPDSSNGIGTFTITGKCNLGGNCMSLLFGDDAILNSDLTKYPFAFFKLFQNCTSVTAVSSDFIPATTLAENCYDGMFQGCSALTTAPTLPATTLLASCYWDMFKNCSKLNYIKMLATDISASNCLANWVSGVASSGTFVKNKNATWNVTGVNGIPSGWTVKTE